MDLQAVASTYKRWAPVYDKTFGAITGFGRNRVVDHLNTRSGSVLEVGVGTGLSLRRYKPHLEVTGIDVSTDMLNKARSKVKTHKLAHVKAIREMDARHLEFEDATFDNVVAMYLVSVVPEPERVVSEMARVCKPGGEVVIVNHFARDRGLIAGVERAMAPFADVLGWHSDFEMDRVLVDPRLKKAEEKSFPPFGIFTFLRLKRVH
jgi:phosphatidylethanolamine/phosphatidyl-N-methylethanolamine N-methyltransferase